MTRFSRCLAVSGALGLCLGCGGSTAGPNGNASGSSGGPGSSGSPGASAGSGSGGSPGTSGSPANGGSSHAGGNPGTSGSAGSAGSPPVLTGDAAAVAAKLGRKPNFLIGLGNDLAADHNQDGAFTLGTTIDLHYAYLSAYLNADKSWGSWKDWNPNGSFINIITDTADAHGVVPMISLYSMAAAGDGVLTGLSSDSFEKNYWADMKLLFERLGLFGKPAVVHLEPDFWAYAEQQSHEDPTTIKVALKANAPDCADLSEDLVGMGHCIVRLARMYAPKAVIGFHASQWANGDPNATAAFLKKVGADRADVIFADMLDRDAGCFEAKVDPNCQRGGSFYWDESNITSPNFHEYLAWSKAISTGVGRPMIWWQIPLGVPSATPGGSAGRYRDNRVRYVFSHIQEFVAAGGLGAAFGVGAANQTDILTDGGQFKDAVKKYYQAPMPLP
ncbi:MAG TPA: hypothetical protein VJV79_04530 [Polyangiaceae bacterium]|nr:hypothetical protein [Polyangiaceae bacterium]